MRHTIKAIVRNSAVLAALIILAAAASIVMRTIVSGFDDTETEGRQTTSKVRHVLPCLPAPQSAHPLERVSF